MILLNCSVTEIEGCHLHKGTGTLPKILARCVIRCLGYQDETSKVNMNLMASSSKTVIAVSGFHKTKRDLSLPHTVTDIICI